MWVTRLWNKFSCYFLWFLLVVVVMVVVLCWCVLFLPIVNKTLQNTETLCELLYCQLSVKYNSLLILRSFWFAYIYLYTCSLLRLWWLFLFSLLCQAVWLHFIYCVSHNLILRTTLTGKYIVSVLLTRNWGFENRSKVIEQS